MDEQQRRDAIAAALDQLPMLVAITSGEDQRLVAVNSAGRSLVGNRPVDVPPAEWSDLLGEPSVERYDETWHSGEPSTVRGWRLEIAGADGEPVEVCLDLSISPVLGPEGVVRAVVGLGQEVTEQVAAPPPEPTAVGAAGLLADLQDVLLPTGLPVPQRAEIAARYLLAEDYAGAGGDWFDAIVLPDGRVVLAVGDVVGHGLEASVVMGELRALFEEAVRVDGDVVAALELLDRRAARAGDARCATVCVGVLDPATGELTYCTAGHPPPVVLGAEGGASYLPASGGGPLCSGQGFALARHQLVEGDLVLFYSDGLVERPGRSPGRNTVELLQVAEAAARGSGASGAAPDERPVERVCRQTIELLTGLSGYADDITVLGVQLVAETPPLELRLAALPDAVRTVRTDLGDWLAGLGLGDLDRTAVQHAVGELVSNAVTHAYDGVDVGNSVEVTARLSPAGLVEVAVSDQGRWRAAAESDGGRGLALAQGFLDELEVEHDEAGTRVVGRHRASRSAVLLRGTSAVAGARTATFGIAVEDHVVHVVGSLDLRSAEELRHACARASRGGTRRICIDLADVELLSSATVQTLFDARAAGPVDIVAPVGSPAQHVLDLVQLSYDS